MFSWSNTIKVMRPTKGVTQSDTQDGTRPRGSHGKKTTPAVLHSTKQPEWVLWGGV